MACHKVIHLDGMVKCLLGNWKDLLDYFRVNGFVYIVGGVPTMTVFCFSTAGQADLLNKYPEVIGMDVTYRTNGEGW